MLALSERLSNNKPTQLVPSTGLKCFKNISFRAGRFYLHKEAQNAQNAQTPLILKILFAQRGIYYTTFKNSFCTKRKLLLYRLKILFAQREI